MRTLERIALTAAVAVGLTASCAGPVELDDGEAGIEGVSTSSSGDGLTLSLDLTPREGDGAPHGGVDDGGRSRNEEAEALLREMLASRGALPGEEPPGASDGESRESPVEEPAVPAGDPEPAPATAQTTPDPVEGGPGDLESALDEIARAIDPQDDGPPPAPEPARVATRSPAVPQEGGQETEAPEKPQAEPATPEAATPETPAPAKPPRPEGKTEFYTFFHKTAADFVNFLKADFADLVGGGHIVAVEGKPRTVLFFGDDAVIGQLRALADRYDDLELRLERVTIRPRYVDVGVMIESLTMAGLCNVWDRVEETVTTQEQKGNKWQTISTHKHSVYAQGSLAAGQTAPLDVPAKVPYVFELPWTDPFSPPPVSTGKGELDNQKTIDFTNTASTEERGVIVAVGTPDDIERIRAFVDSIDRPARQIMIEVQLIELNADKITDIGIDSVQLGGRHSIVDFAGPFPGEAIKQPGIAGARRDGVFVPEVVEEGLTYLFDDTSIDLSGRFLARVHYLVRTGDARVKARPKILTLDDRPSILHIGEEVPTFESTGVTRETSGGNFVTEVNRVTTQYVGFTLNMRPKIAGDEDEIALQLEVVSNQLRGRERVFEEDLAGVPIVARRRFTGMPLVKNHRPIILGGLISEEEFESRSMVPILGEIPVLGKLFSRTLKENRRTEIILVVTPHILSETGVDRAATPKESLHFDTFDSVLFNDRHIIKGSDVWGIDPITKLPAMVQGDAFTEQEVMDLTLLNIVKKRKLVSKLNIFDEYMPDEAAKLTWLQRRFPERSVYYWPDHEKEIYFKAAAIVIENIKELNEPLEYDDIVVPRREIVLPTTPYRMTLSYDKYKTLAEKGGRVLRAGESRELSAATIDLLRRVAEKRTVRHFADYVRRNGIESADHGEFASEVRKLYQKLMPASDAINTDDYGEFFEVLARARINFLTMATYFQENLEERYLATGAPNFGSLETDLEEFVETTVTISQRARRLRELEQKWTALTTEDDA